MDNQSEVREFLATRRAKISPQQAGRAAVRHPPPRAGPAPRGGRPARRAQHRLLHPAGEGQPAQRLRDGARRDRPGAAARRGRARPPARPRPHRPRRRPTRAPAHARPAGPGQRAAPARRDDRGRGDRRSTDASTCWPPTPSPARLQSDALDGRDPPNLARYCFLDPRSHDFYDSWAAVADVTVAILRTEAGRDPHDKALTDLVGELATRSEEFRTRWARHDVRLHQQGTKLFHHPVVGDLTLDYNTIPLPADPGLSLTAYTAGPGTAERRTSSRCWPAGPRPRMRLGTAPPTSDGSPDRPGPPWSAPGQCPPARRAVRPARRHGNSPGRGGQGRWTVCAAPALTPVAAVRARVGVSAERAAAYPGAGSGTATAGKATAGTATAGTATAGTALTAAR